jgi:WD40 repeat protein
VLSVGHSGAPSRATFAGNLFITIAGANAHVVDLMTGLTIGRLPQDGLALAVEASPDGDRLAVATCGHTILVWDLRELRLLHRLQTRSECPGSVAWSERAVTLWSTSTWETTGTWQLPVTTRGLAFSPSGQHIVVAGWGESSVWDVDNGTSTTGREHSPWVRQAHAPSTRWRGVRMDVIS